MTITRVLVVLGTRPEAIKMAPVIRALRDSPAFATKVCVTAQHREMLDQVLSVFGIEPDFDLNVMTHGQHLSDLTARVLREVGDLCRESRPDIVMVHGDTTTTFATSLAAFYAQIPVAHIEAGLRTRFNHTPWPEEMNRCLTSVLATWHFSPTSRARQNLIRDGVDPACIFTTGNTVVDALAQTVSRFTDDSSLTAFYDRQFSYLDSSRRLILVTGHRRENVTGGAERVCLALRDLAARGDVEILYCLHLNHRVRGPAQRVLGGVPNVYLVEPQEYVAFTYLLQRCHFIVTDSGGIQEEAAFLGKPLLLTREVTERPEAIAAGAAKLVGTDVRRIVEQAGQLLDDGDAYQMMARPRNVFGDAHAATRIVKQLEHIAGGEIQLNSTLRLETSSPC